jgi:hypothetical protein
MLSNLNNFIQYILRGPLEGALVGAVLCGLFAMIKWYFDLTRSSKYSHDSYVFDGLIVIGGLHGAIFGTIAGSVGGLLSKILITPIGLGVYAASLSLAAWCVIRTSPTSWNSIRNRSNQHKYKFHIKKSTK